MAENEPVVIDAQVFLRIAKHAKQVFPSGGKFYFLLFVKHAKQVFPSGGECFFLIFLILQLRRAGFY